MNRILVIEDEELIRKQLSKLLVRNSFEVSSAATVEEAVKLEPDSFDLVLADIKLPGAPGTDILNLVEHVPVIMMTSHASVRSAVDSMKLGAIDYVSKPFDHDELLLVIERSLRENRLSAQNAAMRQDLHRLFPCNDVSSQNPSLQKIIDELVGLKNEQRFIFLHGERGTGKELLARLVHEAGDRSRGPLVFADLPGYSTDELDSLLMGGENDSSEHHRWTGKPQSSSNRDAKARQSSAQRSPGAIPRAGNAPSDDATASHNRTPGQLRTAHAGTLILRNIVELPLSLQRDLLQQVQNPRQSPIASNKAESRAVNVRVIALNMTSPELALQEGTLDPEFAACFEGSCYAIPPLRERREDLQELAEHYLREFLRRYRKRRISISQKAMHALLSYHWPGNVNELKSVMERAALMVDAEEINPAHLGLGLVLNEVGNIPIDLSLDGYFRYFVQHYQEQLSETELASKLGISRKALWERRQKMNLPKKG